MTRLISILIMTMMAGTSLAIDEHRYDIEIRKHITKGTDTAESSERYANSRTLAAQRALLEAQKRSLDEQRWWMMVKQYREMFGRER